MLLVPLALVLLYGVNLGDAGSVGGSVVYPEVLEARSDDGKMLLRVHDELTLNLESSRILSPSFTASYTEGGKLVHKTTNAKDIERDLYHDSQNMASLMVRRTASGLHLEGVVGPELRIKPLPSAPRSSDGRIAHGLYDIPKPHGSRHDAIPIPDELSNVTEVHDDIRVSERTLGETVTPEVYLVSDSSHNEGMKDLDELIKYLTILFNSVALRFHGMKDPRMRLRLSGIMRSSFESFQVMERGYMLGHRSVAKLIGYANGGSIPGNPDAVIVLTGRDIATYDNATDTLNAGVAGIAYIAGLCTSCKVGISEDDKATYYSVYFVAHELGHIFGAVHDEEGPQKDIEGHKGAENCKLKDAYLMSYEYRSMNQFTFSPCSMDQFRAVFRVRGPTCLNYVEESDYTKTYPQLPGQRVSVKDQCYGSRPKFEATSVELKVCKARCCKGRDCSSIFVLDGTSCSNGKICMNGRCKRRAKANETQKG